MARINLLPWRQEVREQKNREFMTLIVGVFLLSLLGAFAGWSYFNYQLESQQSANEKVKEENANLDKALKEIESLEQQRDEIIARMKVIQDLQGRRPIPVRVWDDIARLVPDAMYLTHMKREGDVITFKGRADNPLVIAEFIRRLDASTWLEKSRVVSIQEAQDADKIPASQLKPESKYVTFEITSEISKTSLASATASTASATASGVAPVASTATTASATVPASSAPASATAVTNDKVTATASAPATASATASKAKE